MTVVRTVERELAPAAQRFVAASRSLFMARPLISRLPASPSISSARPLDWLSMLLAPPKLCESLNCAGALG
eukprot:COSAG01_NODE_12068_length_1805_cov_2.436108_1_plen_71_part_00